MKTTKCTVCGAEIEYKTKPPLRCDKCKEVKGKKARKKSGGGHPNFSKWKKETQMFYMLNQIFAKQDIVLNGYYTWLPSPKGEPMQLDWFCPKLGIAYEYQGRQHYEYSPYFHKSKKVFKYLQECDALKKELCEKHGITLIHIRYDKNLTTRYLLLKLEEANPQF
jgi:hypothetical protein